MSDNAAEASPPCNDSVAEEEANKAKMIRQRKFVLKEIHSTEVVYQQSLENLVDWFCLPLKTITPALIDAKDISEQFEGIEKIHGLHRKYLDEHSSEGNDSNDESNFYGFNFHDLFEELSNNMHLYSEYLVNFELQMLRRAKLLTSNKRFMNFVEKTSNLNSISLEDLLITPVQRIPRYRLLLTELLKYTPQDHEERPGVVSALEKVSSVAQYNNEAIRARENSSKLMEIMMRIETRTRVDLLNTGRTFIKEGELLKQCRRGLKQFMFWLFSDQLMYAESTPLGYRLHRIIALSTCKVTPCESIFSEGFSFIVESPAKSFIVRTKNEKQLSEWLEAINKTIESIRSEPVGKKRGSIAPLWTPDSHSTQCEKCMKTFDFFFNRRHHCRSCGAVVCDACSKARFLISDVDSSRAVRVCEACYDYLVVQENAFSDLDDARIDQSRSGDVVYRDYDIDDIDDVDEAFRKSTVTDVDLDDFNDFVELYEKKKEMEENHLKIEKVTRRIAHVVPGRGISRSTSSTLQRSKSQMPRPAISPSQASNLHDAILEDSDGESREDDSGKQEPSLSRDLSSSSMSKEAQEQRIEGLELPVKPPKPTRRAPRRASLQDSTKTDESILLSQPPLPAIPKSTSASTLTEAVAAVDKKAVVVENPLKSMMKNTTT